MYKTFEDAQAGALRVISNIYGGKTMECVISETKLSLTSRKTFFNFRFYSKDTNGAFMRNEDGSYSKLTVL